MVEPIKNQEPLSELHEKGLAYYNQGKYEEALSYFEKVLEIDSNQAEAWNGKGKVLLELKEFREALQCFNKALELNPAFEDAKVYQKIALKSVFTPHLEASCRTPRIDD